MNELRPPTLLVAFELERLPRAVNSDELSEGDLRRLVDWISSHDGINFEAWLEWHLIARRQREVLERIAEVS
jgi:hypothetical protein